MLPAPPAHLGNAVDDDFAYVMNHAIEHPLDINSDLAPQSKTLQAFVWPDVGKDRLSYGYAGPDGRKLGIYATRLKLGSYKSVALG